MKYIVSVGVSYPLEDLSETTWNEDLDHMVKRGDHKSAQSPDNEAKLLENYIQEV